MTFTLTLLLKLKPIYLIFVSFITCTQSHVDIKQIKITGPGLRPDIIVMPARYFFVHLYDTQLKRDEPSIVDSIKVEITGDNQFQRACRVWNEVLNRKDGSFIVRYKLHETCYNMEINVKYSEDHVGGSPFKISTILMEQAGRFHLSGESRVVWEPADSVCTAGSSPPLPFPLQPYFFPSRATHRSDENCRSIVQADSVAGSPVSPVHPDDCYCPTSTEEWLSNNECPSSYSQIVQDLETFPIVNYSTFHEHVVKKIDKSSSMSVCNYIIKDNKIHRKCYGQHVGFKTFVDAILTSLARKMSLPDTEMFVNLGDWPLVQKDAERVFPLFSWCGSNNTLDIVMPTYDITESSLEAMGRVSLDMLSVQGNSDLPWEVKEPKAFWRGRDSSRERLKLIEIARKHPDLFNASLTNFFFFRNQENIYGPKEKHISFFKFFDYRYQICLDGTVAAYRLPYLLAGDALVLKHDSDYYEHFYGDLRPWKHFVPVKRDLSDLVERVRWARDNDQEARKIAVTGQQFARNNLLPQHIFCYHTVLLKEWSKRLVGVVEVREGMEEVHQTESKHCVCSPPLKLQHNSNIHSEL